MMYAVYIPRMHMVPQTARGTICMRIHDLAAVRGKLYCDCVQYPYRLTSFHTCRHEGDLYIPIINNTPIDKFKKRVFEDEEIVRIISLYYKHQHEKMNKIIQPLPPRVMFPTTNYV